MKTLNPEWGEVFTFRTPPGKDELDDEDEVELIVYDRDFALHDFIGYTKVDLSGTQAGQILFTRHVFFAQRYVRRREIRAFSLVVGG